MVYGESERWPTRCQSSHDFENVTIPVSVETGFHGRTVDISLLKFKTAVDCQRGLLGLSSGELRTETRNGSEAGFMTRSHMRGTQRRRVTATESGLVLELE